MVNLLNIEFSKGALTVLSNQTVNKQDAILAAILKAAIADLSILSKQNLEYITDSDIYILNVDSKLQVAFEQVDNKIRIVEILNFEIMDSFNAPVQTISNKKFNIQEMTQAFNELAQIGTFNHIEDPFEWQRQSRNEWESRY